MAIKVKLRQKKISGDRRSLYLDFYPNILHPITGKPTRREFLNLYLFEGNRNPIDKKHNKDTITQAEFIRQKRDNEVNKPEIYSGYEKEQLRLKVIGEGSFIEYFKKLGDKRAGSRNHGWIVPLQYLEKFAGTEVRFTDLNEKFCNDFKDFLLTENSIRTGRDKVSNNTASVYFSKFKAALRQVYKDGLIQIDLTARISPIRLEETRRHHLTLEEVNALIKTECENSILKRAAIFSVYSGLRFSDIQKLTWGEINNNKGEGCFINFKQKKTKGIETLPISKEAFDLLGDEKDQSAKVFEDLQYSAYHNIALAKWIKSAGISKPITFHAFRHTYATLLLSLGTDIYTISKLLGHRDLKTTQIYAKIIDETKRVAASRIQLDIGTYK